MNAMLSGIIIFIFFPCYQAYSQEKSAGTPESGAGLKFEFTKNAIEDSAKASEGATAGPGKEGTKGPAKEPAKDQSKEGAASATNLQFDAVKDVLKKDMLESPDGEHKTSGGMIKNTNIARYNFPKANEFWPIMSEYWLVKNAPLLKWDFARPDYGLDESFQSFLETMGHYEKHFSILIMDSSSVFHFALPANDGESIFLLSGPFIRTLNLSKLEISLILFEDYLRIKMGYFQKFVADKDLSALIGKNFFGKKIEKKFFKSILKKYDEMIFDRGFTFEQQFEVTRQMENVLKVDLKLWGIYLQLLQKLDDLTKTNLLYRNYTKIYPSPELQINWLTPKQKQQ